MNNKYQKWARVGGILLSVFYFTLFYIFGIRTYSLLGIGFTWRALLYFGMVLLIMGIFIVPALIPLFHFGFKKNKKEKDLQDLENQEVNKFEEVENELE